MRKLVLMTGSIAALALTAACSPADRNAAGDAAETSAEATGAAASGAMSPGGVVSPPQENAAVNTGMTEADISAGSTSFTEGQARGHIENAGYTGVTGLTKTPDGLWTGTAMKDGKSMNVAVDFRGAITVN